MHVQRALNLGPYALYRPYPPYPPYPPYSLYWLCRSYRTSRRHPLKPLPAHRSVALDHRPLPRLVLCLSLACPLLDAGVSSVRAARAVARPRAMTTAMTTTMTTAMVATAPVSTTMSARPRAGAMARGAPRSRTRAVAGRPRRRTCAVTRWPRSWPVACAGRTGARSRVVARRPRSRSAPVRRTRPRRGTVPVPLVVIPRTIAVIAAPIRADGEGDDRQPDHRAVVEHRHRTALIRVAQQPGIDPAARARQADVAPCVARQAAIYGHRHAGCGLRHDGIVGRRARAHVGRRVDHRLARLRTRHLRRSRHCHRRHGDGAGEDA